MTPTCPKCTTPFDLPDVATTVKDPLHASFECPHCGETLSLADFATDKLADIVGGDSQDDSDLLVEAPATGFADTDEDIDLNFLDDDDDDGQPLGDLDFSVDELPDLDNLELDEKAIAGRPAAGISGPFAIDSPQVRGDGPAHEDQPQQSGAVGDEPLETPAQAMHEFDDIDDLDDANDLDLHDDPTLDLGDDGTFEPTAADVTSEVFRDVPPPINVDESASEQDRDDSRIKRKNSAPFDMHPADPDAPLETAPIIRKRGSFIVGFLKLLVGGVVVLVALQAILWWVLGLDPLMLSASVPEFLLPTKLRPTTIAGPVRISSVPSGIANGPEVSDQPDQPDQPVESTSSSEEPDEEMSIDEIASLGGPEESADRPPETTVAAETGSAELDQDVAAPAATDLDEVSTPDAAEPAETASDDTEMVESNLDFDDLTDDMDEDIGDAMGAVDPPQVEPQEEANQGLPAGYPTYSRNELAAAIADCNSSLEDLDQAMLVNGKLSAKKDMADFYTSLSKLAETATLSTQTDPELHRASRDILRQFKTDVFKLKSCANGARVWINKDMGRGALIVGVVQSIEPAGELSEMKFKMVDSQRTVISVLTRLDPANNDVAHLTEGSRALMMGVIVADPKNLLSGYQGSSEKSLYVTDQIVLIQ